MIRVLLLGLLWGAAGFAQERPPSDAMLEVGRDSNRATTGSAALDIGFENGGLLSFNGSISRVNSRSSGDSTATRSFAISYAINPEALWSFAPGAEVWGARSDLTSRSVLLGVDLNKRDWTFGAQPELKSLVWATGDKVTERRRTGAVGLHLHAEYLGLDHWHFGLRAGGFSYGGQRFENFLYSYVITDAALAQSSALVKKYAGAIIGYTLAKWTFSLNIQKSTYIVDAVSSIAVGADIKYRLDKRWTVGYAWSSTKPSNSDDIVSNALNATYGF